MSSYCRMNLMLMTGNIHLKAVLFLSFLSAINANYQVGVGISDITGPIVQIHFLGFANFMQKGTGLHLRQYARAFIIKDDLQRIAFISLDVAMTSFSLRKRVLSSLQEKYGSIYNDQNVVLSATHTHSAPGGYMADVLYDISTLGFVQESFDAIHFGILKAVTKAHDSIQDAKIFVSSGTILNVNINRSPLAYLLNPQSERDQYLYDVDKELVQLKFMSIRSNELLGVLQWYPVHPTSMNKTNTLVSSDNVGYASILLEQHFNKGVAIGKGPFVAAFASSNLGDVSSNIKGPKCINTGNPCDDVTSTCNGESAQCVAFGPGNNMIESTKIIAERLYKKALELINSNESKELNGPIKYRHRYVNMPKQVASFTLPNGTISKVRGCASAMGYAFAAGTTDGAGAFDFKQGSKTENPMWNTIRNLVAEPTEDDIACHYPKPIFLTTGGLKIPYRWQPQVVSIQIILLGDLAIVPVPGEFTTMAGRRLKRAVASTIARYSSAFSPSNIVIAGLSNSYTSYIATPEEYELQRYEAASTLYGPHTLTIYLEVYSKLVSNLLEDKPLDNDPEPEDEYNKVLSLALPVLFDLPLGYKFGDCRVQPPATAKRGTTVTATFVSGNPRNDLMHDKTFLTIERQRNDKWEVVATDSNWDTKFRWKGILIFSGYNEATVEWYINEDTPIGLYRIRHYGHQRSLYGDIKPYTGVSRKFNVV